MRLTEYDPLALQPRDIFFPVDYYRQPPNGYNAVIEHEASQWKRIMEKGGHQMCCRPVATPPYDTPPYLAMPPQGREFQHFDSITLASVPFTSTDTAVISLQVPIGYDGILTKVVNFFTGTGFVEGSGSMVWRVRIGISRFARNLQNIQFTYGSLRAPFVIPGVGIRLVSNQTITYFVSIPVGSPVGGANARIVCGLFGWFYPRN